MNLSDQKSPQIVQEAAGFQAKLRGASLWDLVQMECLAFSRRVVRITTLEDIGFLYFSGGQIVHARTRTREGEDAVMAILSWEEGSFEVVDAPWPERDTIGSTWQSLIMRAAQYRDENGSKLVVFPNGPVPVSSISVATADGPVERTVAPTNDQQGMNKVFDSMVRLSCAGEVVESYGPVAEELEALAAYSCQLGILIGESLGLEGFIGIDSESKQWRVVVHQTENGMIEAARAAATVTAARMREGLAIPGDR